LVLSSKPFQLGFILVELPLLFLVSLILSHKLVAYQGAGNESDGPPIKAPAAAWPAVLPIIAPVPVD
jgi:hypothetical protein